MASSALEAANKEKGKLKAQVEELTAEADNLRRQLNGIRE